MRISGGKKSIEFLLSLTKNAVRVLGFFSFLTMGRGRGGGTIGGRRDYILPYRKGGLNLAFKIKGYVAVDESLYFFLWVWFLGRKGRGIEWKMERKGGRVKSSWDRLRTVNICMYLYNSQYV